jgi:hypothetical protein
VEDGVGEDAQAQARRGSRAEAAHSLHSRAAGRGLAGRQERAGSLTPTATPRGLACSLASPRPPPPTCSAAMKSVWRARVT